MPVPFSAPHDQITANALAQFMGKTGVPVFLAAGGTTTAPAGTYCAIYFLADTVFSALTFRRDGIASVLPTGTAIASMTWPKGMYFAANIDSAVLTSGQCVLIPA